MSVGLIASCLLVYGLAGVAGNFTLAASASPEATTDAKGRLAPRTGPGQAGFAT